LRRRTIAFALLPLAALALFRAPWSARAAQVDAGTGYELENVQVMDPDMRLADARIFMKEMNDALGLQCRDCHDLRDFASDGNELKLAAREMMKMQRDLNAQWFPDAEEPRVTCWTCHRGERVPPARQPGVEENAGN
jgi:Photosynthetic reaction centre cytochrome C subunit